MSKHPTKRKAALEVTEWNRTYAVGTPVNYHQDNHTVTLHVTRSEARLIGGDVAVIDLSCRTGVVALDRVHPVTTREVKSP